MTFQSAYKVFHSTETSLLKVHNDIVLALDKGENVLGILLEPSAAFDTVNHSLLLSRLQQRYALCGAVLKWFGSYLCNRAQFVNFNESYSSKCVLSVGVPQGSVLGPVLFLMHKSPLQDVIESYNINYHLYADDSQLYVAFKTNDASSIKNRIENCVGDICR